MLFFRSEELAKAWCEAHGTTIRPLVTMDQLWALSTIWYSTRLDPEARRPTADEMPAIFASIGLDHEHWNPKSDRFGA